MGLPVECGHGLELHTGTMSAWCIPLQRVLLQSQVHVPSPAASYMAKCRNTLLSYFPAERGTARFALLVSKSG